MGGIDGSDLQAFRFLQFRNISQALSKHATSHPPPTLNSRLTTMHNTFIPRLHIKTFFNFYMEKFVIDKILIHTSQQAVKPVTFHTDKIYRTLRTHSTVTFYDQKISVVLTLNPWLVNRLQTITATAGDKFHKTDKQVLFLF